MEHLCARDHAESGYPTGSREGACTRMGARRSRLQNRRRLASDATTSTRQSKCGPGLAERWNRMTDMRKVLGQKLASRRSFVDSLRAPLGAAVPVTVL